MPAHLIVVFFWIAISFISGAIPWAVLIAKITSRQDLRQIGDGNPGAANVWKAGGWGAGMLTFILDTGKGFIPVYLATVYLSSPSIWIQHTSLTLIGLAPIVGHAWSPILRFQGGKALATSWGTWMGLTNGIALPVGAVLLILAHIIQRNHAITVTCCLFFFLPIFLPVIFQYYIVSIWLVNIMIIIYKHRAEYHNGFQPRMWLHRITNL